MLFTRLARALPILLIGACAADSAAPEDSTTTSPPPPTTTAPATAQPIELTSGGGPLAVGTYTRGGFRPSVTFTVAADGWFVGTLSNGFFDIQQDRRTPDVVAVQFARVLEVVGDGGAMTEVTTAVAVLAAIKANPGLAVIGESISRLGGLDGWVVEVENTSGSNTSVMRVTPGVLGFDPERRLWISLFDTPDGVVAVLVGGSVDQWERALELAEPVLETIVFAGS